MAILGLPLQVGQLPEHGASAFAPFLAERRKIGVADLAHGVNFAVRSRKRRGARLLDYLISARKRRLPHRNAERLDGPEVADQVELSSAGRQADRRWAMEGVSPATNCHTLQDPIPLGLQLILASCGP